MDENNNAVASEQSLILGSKSWTAYIKISLLAFFLLLIVTPVVWSSSKPIGALVLLLSIALIVYKSLAIKSYQLYFNDTGVWVFSGILPWNKGVRGVKWRDLEDAVYVQSMGSWLFKSYTVRLGHRFTKSNEIVLTHWAQGQEAVTTINDRHHELVRANALN